MDKKKISIAIPASLLSDVSHLRDKTSKVGLIGRSAAIFRVEEIIIYPDNPDSDQKRDTDLIAKLLTYMDTPQYLRKKIFRIRPELRYVGVLPPLRTPHHPLNSKMENLELGEYREGFTLSKKRGGTLVDIGVEKPAFIPGAQLPRGRRVTIRIKGLDKRVIGEVTTRDQPPPYWGYTVTSEGDSLAKILKKRDFDLTIATSKYGAHFSDVATEMEDRQVKSDTVLMAFGAPTQGLHSIVQKEGKDLESIVDFVINTVPRQGTETVRTEEAIMISLAVLNFTFTSEF